MPRSLRLEREGGVYHIINRGNYRQDLFVDEGSHRSFEICLFEACEKCNWVLEGFCVMTNHFHLVVRTPTGNLIYGMKWLQSTFANRYHRYRRINGKLFQGRYKSLLVEESSYLGALLHYVHLNPVRAQLCPLSELQNYRWSSYWYLNEPRKRPKFLKAKTALECAGGLKDSPRGRQSYADYLAWLSTNEAAQKEMAFEKMTRGWALGSAEFKKELLEEGAGRDEQGSSSNPEAFEGEDLAEVNQMRWSRRLAAALHEIGKSQEDLKASPKSADWKVMVASAMKRHTSAPNPWLARELNMGVPHGVSRYVGLFRKNVGERSELYKNLIARITE